MKFDSVSSIINLIVSLLITTLSTYEYVTNQINNVEAFTYFSVAILFVILSRTTIYKNEIVDKIKKESGEIPDLDDLTDSINELSDKMENIEDDDEIKDTVKDLSNDVNSLINNVSEIKNDVEELSDEIQKHCEEIKKLLQK